MCKNMRLFVLHSLLFNRPGSGKNSKYDGIDLPVCQPGFLSGLGA